MSDVLIVAALAAVAIIAAMLSLLAWHLLGRRPAGPDDGQQPELDSDDPAV